MGLFNKKKAVKRIKKIIEISKKIVSSFIINILLTTLLFFLYIYVGGYKLTELKPVIFSTIFIPIMVLFSNYVINSKLNEDELLEKYIKQNDLFYEKGLITTKQYELNLNDLKKKVQNLPRYK